MSKRWGSKKDGIKRRDLTAHQLQKFGYPGAMREQEGWRNGARVSVRQ